MKTVLFVCTGNTCRSPMAACLFNAFCERQEDGKYHAVSAGLQAFPGEPASNGALRAMERRGLNLQEHRAQPVTEALVSNACLIVCMSKAHVDALRIRFPLYTDRVCTFSATIPDPFGGDDELQVDYEICDPDPRAGQPGVTTLTGREMVPVVSD